MSLIADMQLELADIPKTKGAWHRLAKLLRFELHFPSKSSEKAEEWAPLQVFRITNGLRVQSHEREMDRLKDSKYPGLRNLPMDRYMAFFVDLEHNMCSIRQRTRASGQLIRSNVSDGHQIRSSQAPVFEAYPPYQ